MGNTASGEEGRHRLGYHVLRVKDDSPAYRAGIRPFFDYITAVNGVRLNSESTYLQDQMLAHEDKPLMLDIYSTREQAGRRVEMIPTRKWGDGKGGLIGCSIRFCMFDAVNDVVWHILDVAQGSPAEKAGLCAHSDYVIGTPYGIMRGEGDLYDLVEDNIGEPLRLHVYNSETDHIVIIPNEEWGGEGLLGCDVGYGYLHRLPRQGSMQHRGSNGSPRKTPSLPTILEGALQNASKKAESEEIQEQDLPPFRFGRGERPDAEDEPESEDEFVPRGGRGQAAHKESSALPPNFMNKFQQGVSLHHDHDIHTPHPSLTGIEENQSTATTVAAQHPMSPTKAPQKTVDVNAGEIPFGPGSTHDFSSTLGMNSAPFR
ncbi:Golgi reassembly-stacking protein 2 [Linnemannia elongata]|nr:Golgi reassembly-stacking protein 2 [Linnemannia elongata]